jgi:CHASE3 domain sensor protein
VLLVGAVVCGTAGWIINTAAGNPSRLSKHALFELGGSALVLLAAGAVLLLFALSRFNRAREATKHERQTATARQLAAEHLTQARRLAGQLLAGEAPTVEKVWDVVLQPGERVLLDEQ